MRRLKPCEHCGSDRMWHERGCKVVLAGDGYDIDSWPDTIAEPSTIGWEDVVINPGKYTKGSLH